MRALVVYGSRHGSTRRIAEELSSVLTGERFEVRVADAREMVDEVGRYDLVIVGSAIQQRSWLREVKRFMKRNEAVLRSRPVWLFSSGLRSDDPRSVDPRVISGYQDRLAPREHRFFPGSFDPDQMGPVHRALVRLPGVRSLFPVGDFRDWDQVRAWARSIAQSQKVRQVTSGGGCQA